MGQSLNQRIRTPLVMLAVALIAGGVIYYSDHRASSAEQRALVASVNALNGRTQSIDYRIATTARTAQLKACRRGNVLRGGLNDTSRTQEKFLRTALAARRLAVKNARNAADHKLNAEAAAVYATLLAHEHIVPLVNCAAAFPLPLPSGGN
jgi:hypothetical protein